MEQSLKHTVFSVIVLQLNRSRYMKSLCWIIVLAVIYHCTVLHSYLLPNYCRNPYQSITLMQVNVESALYNHHPTTNHILRERMDCALNSNIVIFSFLCVYLCLLNPFFDCILTMQLWYFIDESTNHIFRMNTDPTISIESSSQYSFYLIQFNQQEFTQSIFVCWDSIKIYI